MWLKITGIANTGEIHRESHEGQIEANGYENHSSKHGEYIFVLHPIS